MEESDDDDDLAGIDDYDELIKVRFAVPILQRTISTHKIVLQFPLFLF